MTSGTGLDLEQRQAVHCPNHFHLTLHCSLTMLPLKVRVTARQMQILPSCTHTCPYASWLPSLIQDKAVSMTRWRWCIWSVYTT